MDHLSAADQGRLHELSLRYPTQEPVPAALDALPLDAALEALFDIGPALAALLLRRGAIWVDGARVLEPDASARAGARLVVHTPPGGSFADPEVLPEQIVYEDEDLLAFNKPPGWFSVANPWDALGNLEVALADFLARRDGVRAPIHLVHRLDRDTSGLLLVSKNPALNAAFQTIFNERRVEKRYHAWCAGAPDWERLDLRTGHMRGVNGTWQLYPAESIGQAIGPNQRQIKEARTTFRALERGAGGIEAALVEAELHTGRTHQIRLHLAHLGHPVLGDSRYGGLPELAGLALPHHLLHAATLSLPHPGRSARLELSAPPPPLWSALREALARQAAPAGP
ncbi:MAG TPA: RluA family pseudouridine synthase [Herpetosiphonaceae bacterium]